jgi:hypothetical protein
MRPWLILAAGILASLPSLAEDKTAAPPLAPPRDAPAANATVPNDNPDSSASASSGKIPTDGGFPDSEKKDFVKPTPDVPEDTLECFKHVDDLRKHNDPVRAIDYLKRIVTNGNLLAQDRARAIFELADVLQSRGEDAEALVWTVRTVWPKDEAFWQKQTAQFLLAINQKNADVLPPLVKQSTQLSPEGKSWQDTINHYDALVSYQVVKTSAITDSHADAFSKVGDKNSLEEENDLLALNSQLNQVLPPSQSGAGP